MTRSPVPQHILEIAKDHIQFAEMELMTSGAVPPVVLIHGEGGVRALLMDLEDEVAKSLSVKIVRACCIAHDAQVMVMLSEGWYFQVPEEDLEDYRRRIGGPEDDPNRREVVQVLVAWREGEGRRTYSTAHEILRTSDGRPMGVSLDVLHQETGESGVGRMVNMFPERPPSAEMRVRAQRLLAELKPLTE